MNHKKIIAILNSYSDLRKIISNSIKVKFKDNITLYSLDDYIYRQNKGISHILYVLIGDKCHGIKCEYENEIYIINKFLNYDVLAIQKSDNSNNVKFIRVFELIFLENI